MTVISGPLPVLPSSGFTPTPPSIPVPKIFPYIPVQKFFRISRSPNFSQIFPFQKFPQKNFPHTPYIMTTTDHIIKIYNRFGTIRTLYVTKDEAENMKKLWNTDHMLQVSNADGSTSLLNLRHITEITITPPLES